MQVGSHYSAARVSFSRSAACMHTCQRGLQGRNCSHRSKHDLVHLVSEFSKCTCVWHQNVRHWLGQYAAQLAASHQPPCDLTSTAACIDTTRINSIPYKDSLSCPSWAQLHCRASSVQSRSKTCGVWIMHRHAVATDWERSTHKANQTEASTSECSVHMHSVGAWRTRAQRIR